MLALSRTCGYAIAALSRLQGPDGAWTLTKDIASSAKIPKAYLSTLLNALARNGLIKAKRGYRGGFVLAKPADQITVLRVVEAIEGRSWREGCLLGLSQCSDERACPSHTYWKTQRNQIEAFLRSLTLAQVAEFERNGGAQLAAPGGHGRGPTKPRRSSSRRSRARPARQPERNR